MDSQENIPAGAAAGENEGQLREENARLIRQLQEQQEKYEAQLQQLAVKGAIQEQLLRQGARDPRTILPLLQLDAIRLENGRLTGLDVQLAAIRAENGYLFADAASPRIDSGLPYRQPPGSAQPLTLAGALADRYR